MKSCGFRALHALLASRTQGSRSNFARLADERAHRLGFAALSAPPRFNHAEGVDIIRNSLRYIINAKHCISSLRKRIQPAADDILALPRYTRLAEIYSARRMRCTLKRDDIPLLSQWIKKFDKSKLVEFFGGEERI